MAVLPRETKKRQKFKIAPYLFVIPALILYLLWIIIPMFYTFYLSATNWDGISVNDLGLPDAKFIGLQNFERMFSRTDWGDLYTSLWTGVRLDAFEYALRNNTLWLIVFITVPIFLGLALAIMLNQGIRGERYFKLGIFLPQVLSLAVIAMIWGWVYNPRAGLINSLLLNVFNVAPENLPGWLADKALAIWSVLGAAVWRQIGYIMILYVAGLKMSRRPSLEAAEVDGANAWEKFRHVTFPLLAPVTTIVVVISVIDSLRSFDLVNIMTRGGDNATSVLANLMYIQAFNNYKMGQGAATAVVLFAISFVFIVMYLYRVLQDEMEY